MSVCYYGPGGQCETFPDGTPCPDGWADHPAKVKENRPTLAHAAEAIADAQAQIASMDGDGDGRIGGSLPKGKRKAARKVVSRDPRK